MTKTNNYSCEYNHCVCSQKVCCGLCPSHPGIYVTVKQLLEVKK